MYLGARCPPGKRCTHTRSLTRRKKMWFIRLRHLHPLVQFWCSRIHCWCFRRWTWSAWPPWLLDLQSSRASVILATHDPVAGSLKTRFLEVPFFWVAAPHLASTDSAHSLACSRTELMYYMPLNLLKKQSDWLLLYLAVLFPSYVQHYSFVYN